MPRTFFLIASLFAFLGVALGAFGAHSLKQWLTPEALSIFETAVRYQMYHAFALFVVAWVLHASPSRSASIAGGLFTSGILVFSGSLYGLSLTGIRGFGALTPVGGFCFLFGWIGLGWSIWKRASLGSPR